MAKGLLAIFGWSAIALGLALPLFGIVTVSVADGRGSWWSFLAAGAQSLLAGALLIGFAQVIELLKQIAGSPAAPVAETDTPAKKIEGWARPEPKVSAPRSTHE